MRTFLFVATTIFLAALILGCSASPMTPTSSTNPGLSGQSHNFLGHYRIVLDSEAQTLRIEPVIDARDGQMDVTKWAQIEIKHLEWDPATRNWTINAALANPTSLTGYGVWVVFTELAGKVLLDQDGFIWYPQGNVFIRVPLIAVAKDQPLRAFPGQHAEDVTLVIHWPEGIDKWVPIHFIIDASFPADRATPMVENLSSGNNGDPDPVYFINGWVSDFQDGGGTLDVYADLTPLGGDVHVPMYDDGMHQDGAAGDSIFGLTFNSTAPPGDYTITVHVIDPEQNALENDVPLTILPVPADPCKDFHTIKEGMQCGIDWECDRLVRTQEEYDAFILEVGPWGKPPVIDWDTEMVLGFFIGEMMHGGFEIEVNSICEDASGVLHVDYTKWWPGENCAVPWVICRPHLIVKAERFDGDVVFDGQWLEKVCK